MKLPCMDCGAMREVEPRTVDTIGMAQGLLAKMGEVPLTDREMVRCDPCYRRWSVERAAESARQIQAAQDILGQMGRAIRCKPSILEGLRCGSPASMRALFARCGVPATDVFGWETGDVNEMYTHFLNDWVRSRDERSERGARRQREGAPE